MLALQDPMRLADSSLMVPESIASLLGLLDGSRDLDALRVGFGLRTGVQLTPAQMEEFIHQLDEACLLDSRRFHLALDEVLERYRSTPVRTPAFAGEVYPADEAELTATFDEYCKGAGAGSFVPGAPVVGLISPHIDYYRGWRSYVQAWEPARGAVEAAELVIILGTDHSGSPGKFTLTRQSYGTPWGHLPTDTDLVDRLVEVLGQEAAFDEEVHHIGEHSVELAAVWLHYMAGGKPKRVLPVLCGFPEILAGDNEGNSPNIEAALSLLSEAARQQPTLLVAAGDISHVGPAFGDSSPFDGPAKARVRESDEAWLEIACSGDRTLMEERLRSNGDPTRICGVSPILYMMTILGDVPGKIVNYDQCPADEEFGSLVSVAGVIYSG
jgi:AmmeMemoRadiSam system protein B